MCTISRQTVEISFMTLLSNDFSLAAAYIAKTEFGEKAMVALPL